MNKEKYFENIKSLKLLAKHEVGQNFLINPEISSKIVESLDCQDEERVLEIGSGAGSLSFFLSFGPSRSTLIDIDEGLVTKLRNDFEGNAFVEPLVGNAMKFDYSPYDKIIGNLPYYITSGIIEKALLGADKCKKMVFMVQKEAAERILAQVGTKDYAPLNILLSLSGKAKKLFNVDRASFTPPPHIDSTVISIDMDENRDKSLISKTYKIAQRMFLQRRKTISNNLKSYLGSSSKAEEILCSVGIDSSKRPENLSPEEYTSLTRALNK